MTLYQQLGDGGIDGVAVDVANSAGPLSNAYNTIQNSAGAFTWDASKKPPGSLLGMKSVPAGSGTSYGNWTLPNVSVWSYSVFSWLDTNPDVEISLGWVGNGSARACQLVVLATGKPSTRNFANATGGTTFVNSHPLGQWVRFELSGIVGTTTANGTIIVAMFAGNSATPIETISIAGTANCGTAPINNVRSPFRTSTSAQVITSWAGSVRLRDDISTLLGPISDYPITPGNVAMPSTTDREYAALQATYGPGLSLQDMRYKKYGGPGSPVKSEVDLEYAWWGPAANISMNDKAMINLIALTAKTGLSIDDQRSLVIT